MQLRLMPCRASFMESQAHNSQNLLLEPRRSFETPFVVMGTVHEAQAPYYQNLLVEPCRSFGAPHLWFGHNS